MRFKFKMGSCALGLFAVGALLLAWANPALAGHGGILAPKVEGGDVTVKLVPVADGLVAPNSAQAAPGLPGILFVGDQVGIIWAIDLAKGKRKPFLDVSELLVELGALPDFLIAAGFPQFDERGLLGFAFHPDFASNGLLYTYTSQPVAGAADYSTIPEGGQANHQSVLTEWRARNPKNPVAGVHPKSAREILRVDEPQFNHDGGSMAFGPDGLLYVTLSDGGGQDDKDDPWPPFPDIIGHGDTGNGQNINNPLGSILRIDVNGSNSANGNYGIPPDNPFTAVQGCDDGCDEIYAYGFRNPFRMSFDSETGDLYAGDVGQNDIEEVDVVVKGGNYGWNRKEGSFFFDPNGDMNGFATTVDPGDVPADVIDPVAEYNNNIPPDAGGDGHAIIGGFVYRGSAIPELAGRYVFGDFSIKFLFSDGPQGCLVDLEEGETCDLADRIIGAQGRLFYLDEANLVAPDGTTTKSAVLEFIIEGREALGMAVMGFGQDADGELYLLGNATGTPLNNKGVVLRISPATP